MGLKEIWVCDGCGKELETTRHGYHLDPKGFNVIATTERFWNSVEMDQFISTTVYCERCVSNIVKLLEKILANLEKANAQSSPSGAAVKKKPRP